MLVLFSVRRFAFGSILGRDAHDNAKALYRSTCVCGYIQIGTTIVGRAGGSGCPVRRHPRISTDEMGTDRPVPRDAILHKPDSPLLHIHLHPRQPNTHTHTDRDNNTDGVYTRVQIKTKIHTTRHDTRHDTTHDTTTGST